MMAFEAQPSSVETQCVASQNVAANKRNDFKVFSLEEARVVPGDRRETRDPFRNINRERSGMDPGSPLRSVRDDIVIDAEA
jgi:hypothetical protein